MSNAALTNKALSSAGNHPFSAVWGMSRVMKAAGWIYQGSSDGSAKDTSATASNDKWGTNANPLLDTYPTGLDSVVAWWCARGPSTVLLAMTSAPSSGTNGAFQRGEPVTQATSGATGQLLGFVFDATAGSGWAIIMPRTGTFNGTNVVTGSQSLATFTATAAKTFYREIVLWKAADKVNGSFYYVCADSSAESAQLFSTLMANANCTATVAPAGATVAGNLFPALAISALGTAAVSGGAAASHQLWVGASSGLGNYQALAFNATPASGVSADGTVYCVISNGGTAAYGIGIFALDDAEPGDVDPFALFSPSSQAQASFSRIASGGTSGSGIAWAVVAGQNSTWRGNAGRGNASAGNNAANDVATSFQVDPSTIYGSGAISTVANAAKTRRVSNHPAATPPLVRDRLTLSSDGTAGVVGGGVKVAKGSVRHGALMPIGSGFQTFDTKNWLCVCSVSAGTTPAVAFRYDGATVAAP